jgi:DNA replication licensing factor MCM6
VESSEIDLSEFQDQDRDEEAGSGDGNDNNDADDGQVGSSTAQQGDGTNGEVSPIYFALQSSVIKFRYSLV